ncbi:MAG: endonuclease domain-containing protein [Pseudonocardia sp.]|nr:endonuclease domain-containing protein [Pseudonocardia sp.]
MTVDSLLARQAGVISRRQALAAGLTRDAIDHRVRVRRWRPLHPQVYLAAGHRVDDEVTVRGAVLWGGAGAVLSGVAAAWWLDIAERPPSTVRLTVPRCRNPRDRPGIVVRRRDLDPCDVVEHRGLRVTAHPLTVLDAAVDLGGSGGRFLDRALQRSVRFPAVYDAYCRSLGAHGSAAAGRLLTAAANGSASAAERLLVRMLREAGARGFHCGFLSNGYLIDVAFPQAMLAIEVDGWAWHMDAARTQADKWRQNALVRAGWTVLRFTWHDLVERPQAVLAEIAHAVRRARLAS